MLTVPASGDWGEMGVTCFTASETGTQCLRQVRAKVGAERTAAIREPFTAEESNPDGAKETHQNPQNVEIHQRFLGQRGAISCSIHSLYEYDFLLFLLQEFKNDQLLLFALHDFGTLNSSVLF